MHMEFIQDRVLAPYTTFRIGGRACWFAEATTEEDLAAGVSFARERELPLFVLGGGSNLLVSDQGYAGLILHVALRGMTREEDGDKTIFSVAAGEEWDAFVAEAVAEGCAGLECLSGIPGTVGGTPVQNVGAYGQEVSDTITAVRALDRQRSRFVTLTNAECGFAYRSSIFNTTDRERYIVSRVDYSLVSEGTSRITYEELQRHFGDRAPTLAEVRAAVRSIRARKGMLILPNDPDSLSAGSFFKNPIVSSTALAHIANVLNIEQQSIPRYRVGGNSVKLSAAWLLEQAGFHKGFGMGRAAISTRHTLALINRDGATAKEVIALGNWIKETVSARFGVLLEREPVWVGPSFN
jgi:UDP-N-acetylmuramate dehydrogenase